MSKFKNLAFPLVAAGLLGIAAIVGGVTAAGENAQLEAQEAQLRELTTQVEDARLTTDTLAQEASLASSGANSERVARDTETIGALLNRSLNWKNNAEYTEARESTMRFYGLAEDSAFMTSFLPEAPVNRDSEGNEYPYIDAAGLNSSLGDYRAKVLGVDGIDYRYMVLVDVRGTSSDGRESAVNVATVFVSIDGEGKLSDITGFASTVQPSTSR